MRMEKDAGGKWLIQNAGDALLKLCGHGGFTSWRALQSEIVTSKRLPDGLLEAIYPGKAEPVPFLVELESFPNADNDRQICEAIMAVFLNKRQMPEVISILLKPKGKLKVKDTWEFRSPSGQVVLTGRWRTIKLWEIEAEDLFACNDVGLVPWIPLTHTTSTPAELITRCRDEILKKAAPELQKSMLAITHIMARLNYNDPKILDLLGGAETVIQSPAYAEIQEYLIKKITNEVTQKVTNELTQKVTNEVTQKVTNEVTQKVTNEVTQKVTNEVTQKLTNDLTKKITDDLSEKLALQNSEQLLLRLLNQRFGNCPSDIADHLNAIRDIKLLSNLFDQAISIKSIEEFRKILAEI